MVKEKNNKRKKEERKNQERKSSIITISIFLLIAFIALTGITYKVALNSTKTGYVSLKTINTTLSEGGQSHKLSVKITLSGKNKNLNKLNMENVQMVAKQTIANLDYESIVGEDGNEYIKRVVLDALRQQFGDEIEQVNLDSLLTDVTVNKTVEEIEEEHPYNLDDYLKGFSWSKKK